MSLFTENLAEETGKDLEEIEDLWNASIVSVEEDTGVSRSKFTTELFWECERRVLEAVEEEELILVSDLYESGMTAGEFLEELVSGDLDIQNIVKNRKNLDEEEVIYLDEDDSDEDYETPLDEEDELEAIDQTPVPAAVPENVPAPIMSAPALQENVDIKALMEKIRLPVGAPAFDPEYPEAFHPATSVRAANQQMGAPVSHTVGMNDPLPPPPIFSEDLGVSPGSSGLSSILGGSGAGSANPGIPKFLR